MYKDTRVINSVLDLSCLRTVWSEEILLARVAIHSEISLF